MGPLGTDIDVVKRQIEQLKNFKAEVDPHMVKVEALNRHVVNVCRSLRCAYCVFLKRNLERYFHELIASDLSPKKNIFIQNLAYHHTYIRKQSF